MYLGMCVYICTKCVEHKYESKNSFSPQPYFYTYIYEINMKKYYYTVLYFFLKLFQL